VDRLPFVFKLPFYPMLRIKEQLMKKRILIRLYHAHNNQQIAVFKGVLVVFRESVDN
jgi:hypothetical protein